MARKSTLQPLTLGDPTTILAADHYDLDSPRAPLSPKSPRSPRSPFKFTSTKKPQLDQNVPSLQPAAEIHTSRPSIASSQTTPSLSTLQNSTASIGDEKQGHGRQERTVRSGFFSNYKASKSSSRLQSDTARPVEENGMSRESDRPAMTGNVSAQASTRHETPVDKSLIRRPVGGAPKSEAPTAPASDQPREAASGTLTKKNKPKPFSLLNRTKSIRDEPSPRDPSPHNKHLDPERIHVQHAIKTAPLRSENDRSFRDMMNSNVRQHSADRQPTAARDDSRWKEHRDNGKTPNSSLREVSGHGFLTNLKNGASKGAGALSKGLFGKGRSFSTNEREMVVDDEHYQLKVINKPLIEQTRLTRISKRLEDSRDKTEFWMPAFPWRAIDYLNYKGSDVEGLYRVPGSGPQIKKWQRRFDEELDIDLFEQEDLYDINIIGSMLKAWLRELPDEILPKATQDRISRECSGAQTVPELLIEELSNLSPFNYYLLFAITCHLSLLLAHSEKNKMDYRNLCICFQPCMKIDAFCFKFLVCDWRDCWKGCKTEAHYTELEYQLFKELERPPPSAGALSSTAIESHAERNISSSDSSKPSILSTTTNDKANTTNEKSKRGKGQHKKLPPSLSSVSLNSLAATVTSGHETTPPKRSPEMRPLSPIAPLSPIGF